MPVKKYLLSAACLCFIILNGYSQKNKTLRIHSINQLGLLNGQVGSAFQLQTVNGIQYKTWFAGAGVGLDYYKIRSIPLFFDARKEFGKTDNAFFVYGDIGINFPWATDKEKIYPANDKFPNRMYVDAGIGYKLKLKNRTALLFSAGYSYKKITEQSYGITPPPYGVPPFDSFNEIDYNLERLSIKIGIVF